MTTAQKKNLRNAIAWLVVVVAGVLVVTMLVTRNKNPSADAIMVNDNLVEALKMKQESSKTVVSLAVGALALVLATLLPASGEAGLNFDDGPSMATFLTGTALLIASLWFHSEYMEMTANELWNQSKYDLELFPDVVDSFLNNSYYYQRMLAAGGLFATAAHLLLVKRLKP